LWNFTNFEIFFQARINYTKELWDLTQVYNVLDPARLRGGFNNIVAREEGVGSLRVKPCRRVLLSHLQNLVKELSLVSSPAFKLFD
jgi:hypothetical protein